MKITKNILNEYVDIESEDIKDIENILTMSGTKVETVDALRGKMKDVVVGKILEIKKHPNADKLVVTKTDVKDEILTIVTGAANIKEGDIIPVIKPGGMLPDGTEIRPGNLRGIESFGMLCSAGELGISYKGSVRPDEHGIYILDEKYEKNLGEDVAKILDLDDYILDFEITPNRPDCLGTLGIGREMAAAIKKEFKGYKIVDTEEMLLNNLKNISDDFEIVEKNEDLTVNIEDKDCKMYAAVIIENIKLEDSSKKIMQTLKKLGVDPINNAVDLTNYIMLELGEPLHAFDKDKVGNVIKIRSAKKGEKITLLNEKEYELEKELVICAGDEVSAIAGVMGEDTHSVNEDTKNLIIEIANFDGPRVRRASKAVGVRTESSGRFEKTLPISYVYTGIKRVIELANEMNLGKINPKIVLVKSAKEDEKRSIDFNSKKINDHLGTNINEEEMLQILESLEFEIKKDGKDIKVIGPSFRKDIKILEDLAEEVIRIHGYKDLPSTLPNFLGSLKENRILDIKTDSRAFLKDNGFYEMCTYSFSNEKDLEKLDLDKEDMRVKGVVSLKNKLTEDQSIMRSEVLPEFLNRAKYNLDMANKDLKLFEIGRTYIKNSENIDKDNLPIEENILGILNTKSEGDFYSLKELVLKLIVMLGGRIPQLSESKDEIFHPGISADLSFGKEIIASFGEVHPKILQNFGIKTKIYFAKINLNKIEKYLNGKKKYKEISKFPASNRDIAVVLDEDVTYEEVEKVILKSSKKLIESLSLFDIFKDEEKLGKGKKSFAISIVFRAKDKTLDEKEVNAEMEKIITNLEKTLKASLRK